MSTTRRRVLDNGMTVLARGTDHAPVATFWIWYRVGSRNETPGRTGVSQWVEHMLFKGSDRFPKGEVDRLVSRAGGMFNGLTWLDWTTYLVTLPADRIDLALDIEADRMTSALFEPSEVDSERTVVISEREGHENSPMFLLMEEIQSSAIKVHPYHHEVIGWKHDLETMTRDDLWEHYRRHYHPANAVAVAVGAFDPDDMLDRIEKRFGSIPAGAPTAPVTVVEPEQRGERRVTVVGDDPTAFVAVTHMAPSAADDDFFAFQVMSTILGGAHSMNLFGGDPPNRSSRLYHRLVESGLATAVSSDLVATADPFLYTISAVVQHDAQPQAVEDAIHAEVAELRRHPVTTMELSRAKKQSRAQFAYSAERVTDLGFWMGLAEVVADQSWFDEYLDRLEAVTAEDVQATARRRLDERVRTVGRYRPNAAANGIDSKTDGEGDAHAHA